MRVLLLAADQGGCGFYRMAEPGRVVPCETTLQYEIPTESAINRQTGETVDRIDSDPDAYPYDVIVVQRPVHPHMQVFIREWQQRGIAVVMDVDDDMSGLHRLHPAKELYEGRERHGMGWRSVMEAAKIVDLVTVTTPALAESYARHGRYRILPNCVKADLLLKGRTSPGKRIGYTGATQMHHGDCEVTHGGVQLALDAEPEWEFFKVGGGAEMIQKWLGLRERPSQTGPLQLDAYFDHIGDIDIGIVPLDDTRFNRAKSYLKGLEYSALGIPWVASPVREYDRIMEQTGVGVRAPDRGRNWKARLLDLIRDESLYEEQSEMGRAWAAEETLEGNGWRWTEAWQAAIDIRRGRKAA